MARLKTLYLQIHKDVLGVLEDAWEVYQPRSQAPFPPSTGFA